jgi:hypothetical protein
MKKESGLNILLPLDLETSKPGSKEESDAVHFARVLTL